MLYKENRTGDRGWAFLTIAGDEVVLDIGVTQDLIGLPILEDLTKELKKVGLQPKKIDSPGNTPTGIGRSARALYSVLVPISPGGVPRLPHGVHPPIRR